MKTSEINVKEKFIVDRRKRMMRRRRKAFKFISFVVLSSVTIILLALSPIFNIRDIEVTGTKHLKKQEIIPVTELTEGQNGFKMIGSSIKNLFTLRYGHEEEKLIKAFPYIKEAKVKFILPGKVRIEVLERQPFCMVSQLGANLIIDNEGYVLESLKDRPRARLPQIQGIHVLACKPGQPFNAKENLLFKESTGLLKKIIELDKSGNNKLFGLINSVNVTDESKATLLIDSRLTVNLGDMENLEYRIKYLKEILLKLKNREKGYIDFTAGENAQFTQIK